MKLGAVVRNMGPESTREMIADCARAAERAGLDDVWVVDHVAIPPDDAEGSDGRYLDPLATLAFLAGATERIGLGTAVLILPYQQFLFRPRPLRPPIFVGGAPPHALARAIHFGDGWMPIGVEPQKLRAPIAELRRLAREEGRPEPEVVAMGRLPLEEPARAAEQLALLSEIGVTRLIQAERYPNAAEFQRIAERLAMLPRG